MHESVFSALYFAFSGVLSDRFIDVKLALNWNRLLWHSLKHLISVIMGTNLAECVEGFHGSELRDQGSHVWLIELPNELIPWRTHHLNMVWCG